MPATLELTSNNASAARERTLDPRDFQIQWSDDGIDWTTTAAYDGETGWTASEMRSYQVFQELASGPNSVRYTASIVRTPVAGGAWPAEHGSALTINRMDFRGTGNIQDLTVSYTNGPLLRGVQGSSAAHVVLPLEGHPHGAMAFPPYHGDVFIPVSFREGALVQGSTVDINPGCYCDVTYRVTRARKDFGFNGIETMVEKRFSASEFLETGRAAR